MQLKRTLSLALILALLVQSLFSMVTFAAPKGNEVHALAGPSGPTLTNMIPSNGATSVVTDTVLKLSFDEEITRGTGSIELYQVVSGIPTLKAQYDITNTTSPVVQLDDANRSIVIRPQASLDSGGSYYVLVPNGAILSYATGEKFTGTTSTQWAFTAQLLAPNANNFSPPNNYLAVDPANSGSLSFDFTREVIKGSGFIQVKRVSDNVTVKTIDVTNAEVAVTAINANIWRVSAPLTGLDYNTSYYVLITPGAITSKVINNGPYAGISSPGIWGFKTKPALDTTKPKAILFTPANNGVLANLASNVLSLKFDETVFANSNKSLIIRNGANAVMCTVSAANTVPISGSDTATINLSGASCPQLVNNTDLTVAIDSDIFRDASGNYFDGVSWRFKVLADSTAPAITAYSPAVASTTISVSTTQFIVTFNEPLVALASSSVAQILPQNSPAAATNLPMVVDPTNNTRLLINLGNYRLSPTTSYSVLIPNGIVKDTSGNTFSGITTPYQWTFQTATNSVPTINNATIDGTGILITYSENLDSTKVPYTNNFYVTVNDVARLVTGVTINNNEVRLTLQSAALAGQAVKLSYFPDSYSTDRRLKNVAGNEAAAFSNRVVANSTDTAIVKPTSGIFNGSSIILIFNRSLTTPASTIGLQSQFVVKQGGVPVSISSVSVTGTFVTMTLSSASTSALPVSVSYIPGTNPVKDQNGSLLLTFTDYYIRNVLDTLAPQMSSAMLTGNKLILSYNEGLNTATVPDKASFSVVTSGAAATITAITVVNNTLEMTLSQSVNSNVPVQLFYYPGSPAITDLSGNPAPAIAGYSFTSGTAGALAQLSSSTISNSQVSLVYSSTLNAYSTPNASQYSLKYDGVVIPVNSVSVSGAQVVLTVSTAVRSGQRVTLSYTSSIGNPLKDSLSQQVASFSEIAVTNQGGGGNVGIGVLPEYLESDGAGALRFINDKAATPVSAATSSGRSANRYMINGDKFIAAFDASKSTAGVTVPMVTFKIPTSEAGALVGIPLRSLMDAASRSTNASFRLDYGDLLFTLPLKAINYSVQLQKNGGDVSSAYLLLNIEKATNSALLSKLSGKGAQMLTTPANFSAAILSGGREREIDAYETYVTRTFVLPSTGGAATSDIAVVRMDNDSGDVSYVPTTVATSTSGINVNFMRKGNSSYVVIRNSVSFSDMKSHWANGDVSELAAKFVVTGPTAITFAPGKNITRSEFAEYIARGLGLSGASASAAKFKDVGAGFRTASYIGAVSDAGIVEGSDGKFRPNSPITREEMATILVRAMKYAGVSDTASSTELNAFKDRTKVSSWAKDGVSISVKAGFIKGSTTKTINPQSNATRAEAAIMIKRFLEYVDFL